MAAEPPLNRLVLGAASIADDIGFVALTDIARLLAVDPDVEHRVIGGHMVITLVHRWRLGGELRRDTGDADLGVPPVPVREPDLIDR